MGLRNVKVLILLFLCVLLMMITQGCYRTLTLNDLAREYTGLLGSKSIGDLSLEKIDKIRLNINSSIPVSGDELVSYNNTNVHFSTNGTNFCYSRSLDPDSNLSFNLGLTGTSSYYCDHGYTAGIAYKRGLRMDEDGHYWLVARVGYDYLQESLTNFIVEESFQVDNIQLHQGMLEITLSKKVWVFTPFLSQQLGLACFSYKGGQSGTIIPPLNDLLMTAMGVEISFDDWGLVLATKMRTSSFGSSFLSGGFHKYF